MPRGKDPEQEFTLVMEVYVTSFGKKIHQTKLAQLVLQLLTISLGNSVRVKHKGRWVKPEKVVLDENHTSD